MTPEQLSIFRERLQAERKVIADEILAHVTPGKAVVDDVESAIVTSDENLVEKIDFALSRIDDGTYGICIQCKSEIPIARLEAKPAVSLCASCQQQKEQREHS